jgi:5-methyltetrahydropteroyltriglutamate--homocysteine methyltransferase
MRRSDTRILTTHAGSLPRPQALTKLYVARASGAPVNEAEIVAAGRDAVAAVVARQRECGVDIVGNGEQQRESFVLYLKHRLGGLGGQGDRTSFADVDAYPEFQRARQEQMAGKVAVTNWGMLPKTIGPITYEGRAALDEECDVFAKAMEAARGDFVEPFMTAPSPGILAAIVKNEHYDTQEAYLAAIGAALQVEYEAIVKRGFLLQLDCPDLALERHVSFKAKPLSEFLGFVEMVIAAINTALRNIPRNRVRLHACWGNYEGPHDRDVPLADILPIMQKAKAGGFMLPFGNARHAHEYNCFRASPLADDQVLIAGVIDTLTNVVEHPEAVAERLERVARVVGDPSRVQAGTDCGFDTSAGMGRVAPDIVWAKLKAMRDGAAIASERLFGGRGG